MKSMLGMKVVVSPFVPPIAKWELRADVPCTEAFRVEFNQWLKDFFGTTPGIARLEDTWYVSPEGFEELKRIERENALK